MGGMTTTRIIDIVKSKRSRGEKIPVQAGLIANAILIYRVYEPTTNFFQDDHRNSWLTFRPHLQKIRLNVVTNRLCIVHKKEDEIL